MRRSLSRSALAQVLTRLLIKLLLVAPLPQNLQVAALLYPVSIAWDLLPSEGPSNEAALGPQTCTKDAFGKTITYAHDVAGRQEVVTDRNGKTRVLSYNDRGNVTKEIDAEGKQVLRTFDGRDNRLSETLPHDPTNANPPKTTFAFDASDNLLSMTDPLNNTSIYTYNSRKQVLTSKDAKGKVTTNVYDAQGNLTSTTDPLGQQTAYTYSAAGNVLTQTQTVGGVPQTTTYEYDAVGNVTKETDANGHATTYTYDAKGNRLTQTTTRTTAAGVETLVATYEYDKNGRVTKTTDPDATFTRTVYNANGQAIESYDKLNRKTAMTYDEMGRLIKTTFPDNTTEQSTYDNEGRRLTSQDRAGRITSYQYDGLGRLTRTTFADNTYTQTVYDSAGRATQTIDARLKATFFGFDDAGRRTSVTDPLSHATTFTYDANGNQQTVKDANQHTTTNTYDDANRRTKTTFADGTSTQTAYDELGRRISETDQAGRTTQFQYDKLGRLIAVIDPANGAAHPTTYTYDETGNRTSQTDANGHTTSFAYDKLGRETGRTLPDSRSETKVYDAAGNLKTWVDLTNRTTTLDYDVNNRLQTKTFTSTGRTVTYAYTATGRRLTASDSVRGTTSYTYDVRDRLQHIAQPNGNALDFTYDANSNKLTVKATVNGQSNTTTYTYDDASRLSDVIDHLARTYHFDWDAAGNRQALSLPNGVSTAYGYDILNRLTTLTATGPSGIVFSQAFTLAANGRRDRIDENGGVSKAYGYDPLDRLTSEQVTVSGALSYTRAWTYDNVGNRTQQVTTVGPAAPSTPALQAGTIDYTHDVRDRLLTEVFNGGTLTSYTFDDNGNLVMKSGEATYTWDEENHLIKVTKTDGTVETTDYDVDGNRVKTTLAIPGQPTKVTNYLVDTSGGLSHVVAESDSTNTLTALYLRADDLLLAVMRPNGTGWTTRYVHADPQGSVRALTDESGNVTDRFDYDADGVLLNHVGNDPIPYAFAGEPRDPITGLQNHRARWYDPRTGTFTSMDAFAGRDEEPVTLHRYLYAAADPVNKSDPSGMDFGDIGSLMVGLTIMSAIDAIALPGGRDPFVQPLLPLPPDQNQRQLAGVVFAETLGLNLREKVAMATTFAYRAFEAGICPAANGGAHNFGDGTIWGAITTNGSAAIGNSRWNLVFQGTDLAPYGTIQARLVEPMRVREMNESITASEEIPIGGPFDGLAELSNRIPIAFNQANNHPDSPRWERIGSLGVHTFYGFIPGRDCR